MDSMTRRWKSSQCTQDERRPGQGLHPRGRNYRDAQAGATEIAGQSTGVGITLFDMASDGKKFTLYIPSKNIAYKARRL